MQVNTTTTSGEPQSFTLSENGAKGFMTVLVNKGKDQRRVRAYFNATFILAGDDNTEVTNMSIDWLDLRYTVKGKWEDYPKTNGRVWVIEKMVKEELVSQSADWYQVA